MSDALAIAGVSAALRALLTAGLTEHLAGDALGTAARVFVGPPGAALPSDAVPGPRLCLFLFRLAENAAMRNVEPPARVSDGHTRQSAPLVLELEYLLTCDGVSDLQAELLLGAALLTLRASPVLRSEAVRVALHDAFGGTVRTPQYEQVRITPTNLRTDELTQLWRALQTPLRASITCQVSAVLIDSVRDGDAGPR